MWKLLVIALPLAAGACQDQNAIRVISQTPASIEFCAATPQVAANRAQAWCEIGGKNAELFSSGKYCPVSFNTDGTRNAYKCVVP
jgi:hypothetical protein